MQQDFKVHNIFRRQTRLFNSSAPRRNLQQLDSGLDFLAGEDIANLLWRESISDSDHIDDYETLPDYSTLGADDYDDYNYEDYLDYNSDDYLTDDYNFRSEHSYLVPKESILNEVDDGSLDQNDLTDDYNLDGFKDQLYESRLPDFENDESEQSPDGELYNDLQDGSEQFQIPLVSSNVVSSPLLKLDTLLDDRSLEVDFDSAKKEPFDSALENYSDQAEIIDDDSDQELQKSSEDLGSEEFLDYDDHRLMWDFYRRLQEGYHDMLQDYIDANTDEEITEGF